MKKKVLFILHIPPPVHGASMVGKYIMESAAITGHFNTRYINLSTSASMEEIGRGGMKKIVNLVKIQGKVLKALFSQKYDLCYVTLTAAGGGFYKDLMVVMILKLFRKKIVYHFHNKGVAAAAGSRINNLLYRFAFRNTKSILLSPGLYSDFKKYLAPGDVYFCPNGVPVNNSLLPEKTAPKARSVCRLLFLSNMIIEKGVVILLEACKKLQEDGNDFECHFVGAWTNMPENDFNRLVNDYGLAQRVFAHGPKFGSEKAVFFARADIFVLPTYYYNECFPLVLLEAMSYALPVVSTFEGGIPDIVADNETGYVVPQKDPVLLAGRLATLIQDIDLRRKLGMEGKKRFGELFTVEKFENNLITILQSCINEPRKI